MKILLVVQRPVFSEMRNPGGPPVAYEYRVVEMPSLDPKVVLTPDEHVIAALQS